MASTTTNHPFPPKPLTPLKILIIGGGITGLTTALALARAGHASITLLDAAPTSHLTAPTNSGGGLLLAPNATRLLARLDLLAALLPHAVAPTHSSQRRWADDAQLSKAPLGAVVERKYNAPMLLVHRADLHRTLLDAVQRYVALGVIDLHLGVRVAGISTDDGVCISTVNGTWVDDHGKYDVILAADGVHSAIRKSPIFTPRPEHDQHPVAAAQDASYRFILPRAALLADARTRPLIEHGDVMVRWMGPGQNVVGFPLRGGAEYYVIAVRPNTKKRRDDDDVDEMLACYAGWNATVLALLEKAPSPRKAWPLTTPAPLAHWVSGRVALLGDAAHAMLPYVAQGAAQGIEDAATVAYALGMVEQRGEVPLVLRAWEAARRGRVEAIQSNAVRTGQVLHLEEGEAQRRRDEALRGGGGGAMGAGMKGERGERGKDMREWSEREWIEFMFEGDVVVRIAEEWEQLVASVAEAEQDE